VSDISTITNLVRYLIEDFSRTQIPGDIFSYSSSSVFTLSETNIITLTVVKKNDAELSASDYAYDSTAKQVTINASLTIGDTVEIQYTYYSNYSDTEIESYIRAAAIFLSVNNYYTFEVDTADNFYPAISDKERNLIAFVASILIKPDNQTIRLPDITITVPNNLPTRDIVSKAVRIFKSNTTGHFDIVG
jgi:hypothetical protein